MTCDDCHRLILLNDEEGSLKSVCCRRRRRQNRPNRVESGCGCQAITLGNGVCIERQLFTPASERMSNSRRRLLLLSRRRRRSCTVA